MVDAPPSRVIHLRNVTDEVSQQDIHSFMMAYGKVENVLMLRDKNQALVEMEQESSARALIWQHPKGYIHIGRRKVWMTFSRHRQLTAETGAPLRNRILLVTFHPEGAALPQNGISCDSIFYLISPYGTIERIVVIHKEKVQALVQFADEDTADSMKEMLQSKSVLFEMAPSHHYYIYKIDVQYSNLTDLTIKPNNNKSKDYIGFSGYPNPGLSVTPSAVFLEADLASTVQPVSYPSYPYDYNQASHGAHQHQYHNVSTNALSNLSAAMQAVQTLQNMTASGSGSFLAEQYSRDGAYPHQNTQSTNPSYGQQGHPDSHPHHTPYHHGQRFAEAVVRSRSLSSMAHSAEVPPRSLSACDGLAVYPHEAPLGLPPRSNSTLPDMPPHSCFPDVSTSLPTLSRSLLDHFNSQHAGSAAADSVHHPYHTHRSQDGGYATRSGSGFMNPDSGMQVVSGSPSLEYPGGSEYMQHSPDTSEMDIPSLSRSAVALVHSALMNDLSSADSEAMLTSSPAGFDLANVSHALAFAAAEMAAEMAAAEQQNASSTHHSAAQAQQSPSSPAVPPPSTPLSDAPLTTTSPLTHTPHAHNAPGTPVSSQASSQASTASAPAPALLSRVLHHLTTIKRNTETQLLQNPRVSLQRGSARAK